MLIKAEQKFVSTSPRKLRLVVDAVRKIRKPQEALAYLEHMNERAAKTVSKVIKQAIANATNNANLPIDSLIIGEMQVGDGPTYKRGRPVSRGRFHPIMKRTSHVRVILETKEEKRKTKNV